MFRTKLRYCGSFGLTTGAAGITGTAHIFNLGSLFDPDSTSFGHYPYGFDQLKVLYSRYRVDRTSVKIIASTIGGTAEVGVHACIMTPDGFLTLAGITFDAACERPNVATVLVSPSGNSRTTQIDTVADLSSFFGVTKQEYQSNLTQYSALVTANPTLAPSLSIAASSPSGTASESVTISVILEYECVLFEPFTLAQST